MTNDRGQYVTPSIFGKLLDMVALAPKHATHAKSLIVIDCDGLLGIYVGFDRDPTPYQMWKLAKKLTGIKTLDVAAYDSPGYQQWIVLARRSPGRGTNTRTFTLPPQHALNPAQLQSPESPDAKTIMTFAADWMGWPSEKRTIQMVFLKEDDIARAGV